MRPSFNFYASYYEVYTGLSEAQKPVYMDTLLKVHFLELHIDEVSFKDPILALLWKSQRHSIETSLKGFLNIQKRLEPGKRIYGCYKEDYELKGNSVTPTEGVAEGPKEAPAVGGSGSPSPEIEVEIEIEGEIYKGEDSKNDLLNEKGLMELDTAKKLMQANESWQKMVLQHLARFDHLVSYSALNTFIEEFFKEKADDPTNLRDGVAKYQDWFKNWVKVELKKRGQYARKVQSEPQPPYLKRYNENDLY